MIIKTAKYYKNVQGEQVSIIMTKENDNHSYQVPIKDDNTEYQEIMKWVAAGNTIEEAD
tara:strand:- start:19 stop:195 length:177 start_codon:yes stop_codon:yes gene_type:complete